MPKALVILIIGVGLATAARADGLDAGKALFNQRCAQCHGASGGGDGFAGLGLSPRPRVLRDPAWQASITDETLAATVVKGGAAFGKSPMMAANPDLAAQPEQLAALVRYVRSLKGKEAVAAPSAPSGPSPSGARASVKATQPTETR